MRRRVWQRVFDWLIDRSYVSGVAAFLLLAMASEESILHITAMPLHVTAAPLFLVTILELVRNRRLHAAAFLRNHMAEFLVNDELQSAFHDLILNYTDDKWVDARAAVRAEEDKYEKNTKVPTEIRDRVWEKLNPGETPTAAGNRRYHPMFFQGSEEERRLDRVLHHFGLIAHYWSRRAIDISDISGVAGYHLGVIGTREVSKYYIKISIERWDYLSYRVASGTEPPFKQLETLLKEMEKWQKNGNASNSPRGEATR